MRTTTVICVCAVSWSFFAVALFSDDDKPRKNHLVLTEDLEGQISRERLIAGSVSRSDARRTGTIRPRRGRDDALAGEETDSVLIMRHARHRRRGRYKNGMGRVRGTNVKKHHQIHEKRNFEKQVLVRNRTLELLGKKLFNSMNATPGHDLPKPNVNILLERGIATKTVGDILGENGAEPRLKISDLLMPKTLPKDQSIAEREYSNFRQRKYTDRSKTDLRKDAFGKNQINDKIIQGFVETNPDFFGIESEQSTAKDVISTSSKIKIERNATTSNESVSQTFLRKLKTIAANDTGIALADPKSEENVTELEIPSGDFYRNDYRYDYENVYEEPSVSSLLNPNTNEQTTNREDFSDSTLLSSVYMPIDDQIALHESLAALLSRLFQTLRNTSGDHPTLWQDLDYENSLEGDLCQKWLDCKDKLEEAFLGPLVSLPACPCHYPSSIFYDDKIWDERQQRHFRWRDVSGDSERLNVYKPGAAYCVRSLLAQGGGSAAAQHCCYDRRRRLLTRGSGAGTPNFVSPEVSAILHERIDILPWRLCKGDFSRFNEVRPPNNDNYCKMNPDEEEYQRQIDTTKYY